MCLNAITYNLARHIDKFLQPLVWNLQSFVKDWNHIMEILSKYIWQKSYLWASLDMSSLYTSIQHEFGLRAMELFLAKSDSLPTNQILNSTEFVLSHNYFSFLDEIRGTAMGARFALSYANLFMGYWKENCIWAHNPYGENLVLFTRYIDDIVVIWDGTIDALLD